MNIEQIKQKLINFIKKQADQRSIVLGLSGGIDSAVVAYLATQALGKEKVHAVIMPSNTNSPEDSELAQSMISLLGINSEIIEIDNVVESFKLSSDFFVDKKNIGNLKARIRMSFLYGKANKLNALVLGTGNKSEIMVGYFTKYGDGGVDLLPLGDLYKNEVRELAKNLGVPSEIINRPPSAGLWEGQTDEQELGISYEELDEILHAIENDQDLSGFDDDSVELVKKYTRDSEHKRKQPVKYDVNRYDANLRIPTNANLQNYEFTDNTKIIYKELSYQVNGMLFKVHNELGKYCNEKQVCDRIEQYFKDNNMNYKRELVLPSCFSGEMKGRNRIDFLVDDKIILEIKCKRYIGREEYYQVQRYLHAYNKKLGILVNFRDDRLEPNRVLNSELLK